MAQEANKGRVCPRRSATSPRLRAFRTEHEDRCCHRLRGSEPARRWGAGYRAAQLFLACRGGGGRGVGAPGPWGALQGRGRKWSGGTRTLGALQGRGAEEGWGHPGPGGAGGRAAHPEDKAEAAHLKGGKMSAWPRATAREPFKRRSAGAGRERVTFCAGRYCSRPALRCTLN